MSYIGYPWLEIAKHVAFQIKKKTRKYWSGYTLNRKRNVTFKKNLFNTEITIKNVILENVCVD
jgi:hypothetical protein